MSHILQPQITQIYTELLIFTEFFICVNLILCVNLCNLWL